MFLNLNKILGLLLTYRYLIIFPIAVAEGPIISILCGLLVSNGSLNIYTTYTLLVTGDVVGDCLYYFIGRFGGNPFIRKWGRFFGIQEDKIKKVENYFRDHEVSLLLYGKAQPVGGVVLAAAGFVKMRFDRFILVSLLGTIIKTGILFTIGYYFGKAYVSINNYFSKGVIIYFLVLLVGLIIYFVYKRKKIWKV